MGAKTGIALKGLQWFIRGVQFLSAALVFAIYCYFLATLANSQRFDVPNWVRAVVGITGFAALYSGIGLLVLCWIAGHKVISFFAIVLDIAFAAAFIYVAVSNRGGAGSCSGIVTTPFGTADADTNMTPSGSNEYTALPNFHTACKLQSACLAISIVAIVFYIFSALNEVALARHRHKENRFGPGPQNNYTSGYGRKGFLGFLKRSGTTKSQDPNVLPKHATPADMREPVRDSYTTERTAVAEPAPARVSHSGGNAGAGALYPNKYADTPAATGGDDALPMNTAQPVRPRGDAVVANGNNPYDAGRCGSTNVNNPYDNAAPGPYPGSFSRPRPSEEGRAPGQQYPRNYRYSDGVYDA